MRAVWQIDAVTGERLKQYASVADAANAMPFPHPGACPQRGTRISKAIRSSGSAFGFKWEYVEPADKDTSISVRKAGTHRAIWKLDKETGRRLERYRSLKEASESLSGRVHASKLSKACRGHVPDAYGFRWEYANDDDLALSNARRSRDMEKKRAYDKKWAKEHSARRARDNFFNALKKSWKQNEEARASGGTIPLLTHEQRVPGKGSGPKQKTLDKYGIKVYRDESFQDGLIQTREPERIEPWPPSVQDVEVEAGTPRQTEPRNGPEDDPEDNRVDASGSEPDPRKEVATRVLQQLVDCGAMMPTLFEPLHEIIYSEMKHPYLKDQQEFVLGHAKTFQCGNVQDLGNAIMWKDDLIFHAMTLKEYECANMKKNLELQKNVSNEVFTSLREHICKTLPADILAEVGTKETGFKEFILTVIIAIAKKCTEAERFADHTEQKLKSVTEERNALASARENYTEFARMISRDKEELVKFHDALYQVRIDETEKEMREAQRAVDASAEKLQELKRKRVSIEDSL